MRFREDLYVNGYDMGTSGTVSFNVDYSDVISQISIQFNATNGASGNKNNPIESNITSIELVDGSDVLWSLPGDVAFAMYNQVTGKQPKQYYTGAISDGGWVVVPILFGRYLYDPVYGFNPIAFRNPQLKITFDEATIRAAGATGFVSDSFTCSVLYSIMEDVPAPRGFLTAKDVYDYTTLASGDTTIDMPTDYPYRLLMSRVYEAGQWFGTNVSNYKLTCDGGKFVPFDLPTDRWEILHKDRLPMVHRGIYTVCDDGETHQLWLGIVDENSIHSHVAGDIATTSSPANGQVVIGHKTHAGAAVNANPVHMIATGWHPHNLLVYPFGRLDVPEEWFDARAYNSVKFVLTNGNAGAEANVCVQQVRMY
ncbi:MAG: hypothetical protein GWN13_03820 [Phycisphaerae bacterium]|nr:hypothetical protein [Phycisphaerae bacterium]